MDKYQEFAIRTITFGYDKKSAEKLESLTWDYKFLTITQNENYNITKYKVDLLGPFEKVEYMMNGQTFTLYPEAGQCTLDIDFNNEIECLKIFFGNEIVNPISISIIYVEADKKKYDDKIKAKERLQLELLAKVSVTTGESIINVRFQPVSKNYSYSEVILYTGTRQLMAKYKTPKDVYFHSIPNLAYGKYLIELIEYDNENNVIYKSEAKSAVIEKPEQYKGPIRHIVTPR